MSQSIYHLALVFHIIGITVMAGTTFIDFITFRLFNKSFGADKATAVIAGYLYKLQQFMGIGMLVILLSGVAMMVKLHELWGAQTWFRIKMGILLLIIVNGLGLRRRVGTQLKKILATDVSMNIPVEKLAVIKNRLTTIQTVQMLLFVIVYTLSVYKFN
jgi:hypothetical protein